MTLARAIRVARDIAGCTEADVRQSRDVLSTHILRCAARGLPMAAPVVGLAFDRVDTYLNSLDGVAA